MAGISTDRYSDGNVWIKYGDLPKITIDHIRLVGTKAEIMDTLRWEFLGHGQSLKDNELERIAERVMGVME